MRTENLILLVTITCLLKAGFHLNSFDYGQMLLCQKKLLIEQVKTQKVVTLSKR